VARGRRTNLYNYGIIAIVTDGLKGPMRVEIAYGRERLELDLSGADVVPLRRSAPTVEPIGDLSAAVREALESPHDFPALRRALTPDDHVTIVVDDRLPRLAEFIAPLLEHILLAGVSLSAITLVLPPQASARWLADLPAPLQGVHIEHHDPDDRRRLAYLATTRGGRRVYLNRSAVDADQLVVVSHRGYDSLLGYAGSEGSIYPALSDTATQHELVSHLSQAVPGAQPWPVLREAGEVAWLLGAPFMLQAIDGQGSDIAHVVAGLADTSALGQRLLDERWRVHVDEPASTVVATLEGDPAGHTFADLAQGLAAAARVVEPSGRIILLTQANPELGPGAEMVRGAEDPAQALRLLRREKPADMAAAFAWASAAQRASIYLLSGMPAEVAEELFATPLDHDGQVQRLLSGNSIVILPDAHRIMAVAGAGRPAQSHA
jgi:nickel-dependent lactate racemase